MAFGLRARAPAAQKLLKRGGLRQGEVRDAEIIDLLAHMPPDDGLTSGDVASVLHMERSTAQKALRSLLDGGRIGINWLGRTRLYWAPPSVLS